MSIKIGGHAIGFEIFSLLALPFIYIRTRSGLKISKWFFYLLLYGHLLVIYLLQWSMQKKRIGGQAPAYGRLDAHKKTAAFCSCFLLCKSIAKWPCAAFSGTAFRFKRVGRDAPHAQKLHAQGFCMFFAVQHRRMKFYSSLSGSTRISTSSEAI